MPSGIGYEVVPLKHGPQWSDRSKDRLEYLISTLVLVCGVACMVVPFIALSNYPQGLMMEPVMSLEKLYIFLGGLLLFVIEIGHGGSQSLLEFQNQVFSNCRLLERVTGKGLALIFLGCNVWNILNPDTQSLQLQVLFVTTGLFVIGSGVLITLIGLQKMILLERIRRKLQLWRYEGKPILPGLANLHPGETYLLERLNNREQLDKFLTSFATTNGTAHEVMLDSEFNSMCQVVLGNPEFQLSPWEVDLIVTSISAGGAGQGQIRKINDELGLPHSSLLFYDAIYEWLCPGGPLLL